jgi:hypothetical protein
VNRETIEAPTAIHGPLGPVFNPNEEANSIANYLENLFKPHKVCDTDHERRVDARVQALLTIVDENPPVKFQKGGTKEIRSLKLGKDSGIDGISNECLTNLQRKPSVYSTHLFNHCLRLHHFPASWKEVKTIALQKPGKN